MPRKRSVLSGDEVDLLYDWLERASGLPPELCASDFRSTFPPERLFAATCALLLVMDESRALLPASDLETWLLGVLEALSVDLFGNDTSRRHSDAAPVRTEDGALLPSRTLSFSTSSALVDQFVLCLAPVELAEQQVAVASANAPRSPPDRASCLDLAKAILCRVPCTSMLAFRTPPSGRRRPSSERLKWDYTLCFNERRAMRMSGLMSLAISSSISDAHEKELLQGMEAVPGAVLILAPPTDQWAGFVEKSPDLAVFVARELLKFTAGLEFLQQVASLEPTLHLMELIDRLFADVDPPSDLLTIFVTNWIQETSKTRDPVQQNRLARLLSVFAASLVRRGNIAVRQIEELESFALEHSRTKEAAELFRLLRSQ